MSTTTEQRLLYGQESKRVLVQALAEREISLYFWEDGSTVYHTTVCPSLYRSTATAPVRASLPVTHEMLVTAWERSGRQNVWSATGEFITGFCSICIAKDRREDHWVPFRSDAATTEAAREDAR